MPGGRVATPAAPFAAPAVDAEAARELPTPEREKKLELLSSSSAAGAALGLSAGGLLPDLKGNEVAAKVRQACQDFLAGREPEPGPEGESAAVAGQLQQIVSDLSVLTWRPDVGGLASPVIIQQQRD